MARDSRIAEGPEGDAFVRLLNWLLTQDGAPAGIIKVISTDTLRKWRKGMYPQQRSASTIAAVDQWARRTYPGAYPPEWAPEEGLPALAGSQLARPTTSAISPVSDDSWNSVDAPLQDTDGAQTGSGRWLSLILGLTAVTVGGLGVIIVIMLFSAQHPANSSMLYARGGGPVAIRECPALNCRGTNFPTGTKVTMVCWRDAKSVDLNYSSSRWFNVRHPGGSTGWVHSSEVESQTRVGPC